ncbi:MAG TPA: E2/UBC family protein [Pirellulales bacterium]|jgi:hypothetical protein
MAENEQSPTNDSTGAACHPVKWAALVNDVNIPVPQRRAPVSLIKAQAGLGDDQVLVRDHNSPDDVVLENGQTIDLGEGNVFYSLAKCEVQPREHCASPPKLAYFVDDRPEITIQPSFTSQVLRELFGVHARAQLFRDSEGPRDEGIVVEELIRFIDGPVFYTREIEAGLHITVNAREFTEAEGVLAKMTHDQIAALVYPEKPSETRVWLVSEGNREIGANETVDIHSCQVFDVVRKKVDGGYEESRVQRELGLLQAGGQHAAYAKDSTAVIYRALRTRPGFEMSATDVLVKIPGGYPGQMLDGAYLPENSPLIGRVKGQLEAARITADGRTWCLISYHPHNGGGAPTWNPTIHGFHTYIGEILSWLHDLN